MSAWTNVMVTAHRKLPKGTDEWLRPALAERLNRVRADFGTEHAITGMAIGGDTTFADVSLEAGLPLTAAIPFPSQPHDEYGPKWSQAQKKHWLELRDRAAHVRLVSDTDPRNYSERVRMLHERNDWMLERSNAVFAIWAPANKRGSGTYSCIIKAVSAGQPVVLFNLATKAVTLPQPKHWAVYLDRPALATLRSNAHA